MLRITDSHNVSAAQEYFDSSLSQADYYTEGQEIVGTWHGSLAAQLNIEGRISRTHFRQLLQNRDPRDGGSLTARTRADRRPGTDFTFNAPKGVSLLYHVTGDDRITDAHRQAVVAAMAAIEADALTRVRGSGRDEDRRTGNMLWGEFLHKTARPMGDGIPDPHLHTHAYAINVTWDAVEKRFKALQLGDVKADGQYYEAIYHAELSRRMAELGYSVARHGRFWDVAGLPQGLLDQFSRRTAEIEAEAARRGITSAAAKAELGARTRRAKEEKLSASELRDVWLSRIGPADRRALDRVIADAKAGGGEPVEYLSGQEAVAYAMQHQFANRSVVRERELLTTAMRRGYGQLSPEAVALAKRQANLVHGEIKGRAFVTTREILDEERRIIAFARAGRLSCAPLGAADYIPKDDRLNHDQRSAIRHLLRSRDRIVIIEGDAGVGKTSLLPDAVAGLREAGHTVHFFAPTHKATDELKARGFDNAGTLASLLVSKERQAAIKGGVVILDEAGMVSVPDMAKLCQVLDDQNARLALVGDPKQHSSVARGDMLRLMGTHAGIRVQRVKEIMRQNGEYKEAVARIADGDETAGWDKFEALGWVRELPGDERFTALATEYADAVKAGDNVLVVSPTHAEGEKVTAALRAELLQRGKLGKVDHTVLQLRDLRWSEAERSDAGRYMAGQVVQFRLQAPGIKRGQRFTIDGRDAHGRVRMHDAAGLSHVLPFAKAKAFSVYEKHELHLRTGDRVRLTQGGVTTDGTRLKADASYAVTGFDPAGNPRIGDLGWSIATDYGHIKHDYVSTSHASQSATVDRTLVAMGHQSAPAMSLKQLYVSLTRSKKSVTIYTDDKAAVRAAVSASGDRASATELLGNQLDRRGVPIDARREALAEAAAKAASHAGVMGKAEQARLRREGLVTPDAKPVSRSERMKSYTQAMARTMRQRAMDRVRDGYQVGTGQPSSRISKAERLGIIDALQKLGQVAQQHRERIEQERQQRRLQAMDRVTTVMQPREPAAPAASHVDGLKPKGVGHAAKLGS